MAEYVHIPVMVDEAMGALEPGRGGRYVDGTLGGGGHAAAILAASGTGWLDGFDRDEAALVAASARLGEYGGRFELHHAVYAEMERWVEAASCDGVLLDLGVSSPQLDGLDRGFSWKDGPLDMRMDRRQATTAADLVAGLDRAELERIFREYGDEREARRLSRELVVARAEQPFTTTQQLADFIERRMPRRGRPTHPATRVFQALRMAVNDELGELGRGLEAALRVLRPGGRLVVIAFHSGEDRLVKRFGRREALDYEAPEGVDDPAARRPRVPRLRVVTRKPIEPSAGEMERNPRSRSARMRVFERI